MPTRIEALEFILTWIVATDQIARCLKRIQAVFLADLAGC